MSAAVPTDGRTGDDLAGCLFTVLSRLVGEQPAGAVPAAVLEEKLDLIRWLQVELATAEQLLSAAYTASISRPTATPSTG